MFKKSPLFVIIGVWLLSNISSGMDSSAQPAEVELIYDDGEPEGGVLLAQGVIAAVKMSPESGTWKLKTARYYLYQGEGKVCVFTDNNGQPGADLLARFSITADTVGWYDIDLSSYNVTITGEFYVGIEGVDPYVNCSIGHDFLSGGNGRAWDYSPGFDWSSNPDVTYFIRMIVTSTSGVENELVPESSISVQCTPNLFSGTTIVSYTLYRESRISLNISDVNGRQVCSLADEVQSAGNHSVVWDGTDYTGSLMPAGVYFVRLESQGRFAFAKALLR